MLFKTFFPSAALMPYIHHFEYIEIAAGTSCSVIPRTLPVMGFYSEGFTTKTGGSGLKKLQSEFFGMQDMPRTFYSAGTSRMITVHFRDLCAPHFLKIPLNEAFNTEISLTESCQNPKLSRIEDRFQESENPVEAIDLIEKFLLSNFKPMSGDPIVERAIGFIRASAGTIPMLQLADQVNGSQSLLEKRFRKAMGMSPKRFASLVRINTIVYDCHHSRPLTERAYQAGYFDQAHFNRDFKLFTGKTPGQLLKEMNPLGEFRIFDLETRAL